MAKLYFYYSSMNAGKSTTLLQSSHNYQERGMNTKIYTASFDNRFGSGKVASRIGISQDADLFTTETNLFDDIRQQHVEKPLSCVLIDEAQFLTKDHVFQLTEVVDKLDIPVLCYGLRTDFQAKLFEGSRNLLAWADHLKELKTICFCGANANFTVRVNEHGEAMIDGEQIEVGGNERYLSMCRKHYKEKAGFKVS